MHNLEYVRLNSLVSGNATAFVYGTQTGLVPSSEVSVTNVGNDVYLSYKDTFNYINLVRINFTDGSLINRYELNQSQDNIHFEGINSILYGYYTACCTYSWKFKYDVINYPTTTCLITQPTLATSMSLL